MAHLPVHFIVLGGTLVLALNMGIRQALGLFIPDMQVALALPLGTFALALAVQNLLWGLASPLTGALADRYGTGKVLVTGALFYAAGLAGMGLSTSAWMLHGTAGLVIGMGVSGTTFPIVLGAISQRVSEKNRSLALGVASAGGSVGQFVMAPVTSGLNDAFGWSMALMLLGAISLVMIPAGLMLAGQRRSSAVGNLSLGEAFREATSHGGYRLLNMGFFVCGFHVAFIAVHLPNYTNLCGLPLSVAANSLAIIGLFNVFGTVLAGYLGGRYRKKWLLSTIYAARALLILVFMAGAKTAENFYLFSTVMGMLWLSTVPLTSGMVAQIFGPTYLASLFGIVMLSHQIGAFLGAWVGGLVFDYTRSYDVAWMISAGLGFFAAIVHLPIRDFSLRAPPIEARSGANI